MSDFSETGRDMDTFRPVIAPDWNDGEVDDGAPRFSKWMALPVAVGALMGMLVLGLVYVEDHPDVPAAARVASNAAQPPATAPAAAVKMVKPAASAAAPQVASQGFVAIVGPQGARVFDGDTIVGTVPMLHATTPGPHVIRVVQVPSNRSQTFNVDVRDQETTAVVAAVDSKKVRPKPRTR